MIGVGRSVEMIQKTALLGSVRILKKVKELEKEALGSLWPLVVAWGSAKITSHKCGRGNWRNNNNNSTNTNNNNNYYYYLS